MSIRSSILATFFFLLTLPGLAMAEAPDENPVPQTGVSAPAEGAAADANLDRGFFLSTAMTQPAGSVTYNNYELFLHGITYGITDNVQASLTILPPYTKDVPLIGVLSLKGQIAATPRFHLALQGSATLAYESYKDWGGSNSGFGIFGLGAIASYCLDSGCSSLITGNITGLTSNQGGSAIYYGASLLARLSTHVKLMVELVSAAGKNSSGNMENIDGALLNYGVRFHGGQLAADVGMVRPIGSDTNNFVLGFPFVNFSYRAL